ncbi:hypothetical protein [Morganella morganii]|uniref:hypothetical protein n=1 Tax=Morganella morganii TaxID=582 RepID=UPI0021D2FC52|nr:hypothetical protein [Morganella morganii]MCU6223196.1 hypothetical protein [Morganella morganii]MCU6234353.1 hypothetical protein [Morganella morganii]MCU6238116.1 hypothetical protein [Morganella morganii]
MPVNAIGQQPVRETQITGESRNIFQAIADKFVAVVNSCKTFSTGCSTQKDHNIQKACERLAALTLAEPERYTTDAMKRGAEKLGMTLPDSKAAVNSNADISGAASIGKLSVLKTTEYSAQELHDMLSKQLDKPGTSPEMREKIQIALGKADTAINSDIHTKMVGHGVNKLKNIISADILKEHRRNEIGGGTVLDSDIVKELEKSSNSLPS